MASGSGSFGSSAHRTRRSASSWPRTVDDLVAEQNRLARERPEPWLPPASGSLTVGACWVCFPRAVTGAGSPGDHAWVSAVTIRGQRLLASTIIEGAAEARYEPGLLALREGPLLQAAIDALPIRPMVVLVNATGRDHPRRAGLAVHLGAMLDLPTVGVTHRPLVAQATLWPADTYAATSPALLDGEIVAYWLRTRVGRRPVLVHPGWRVDAETAVAVVRRCGGRHRTPAPLREARRLARQARAASAASSRVLDGNEPRPNTYRTD